MSQFADIVRQPDGYREFDSQRSIRKWNKVVTLFYEERIDELKQIQIAEGAEIYYSIVWNWKKGSDYI